MSAVMAQPVTPENYFTRSVERAYTGTVKQQQQRQPLHCTPFDYSKLELDRIRSMNRCLARGC
ncbi:MAG TPA: hypothetical protein PK580_02005 [Nitrosomonas halophila]|nr:hypothetical protein [Nitrosomonas halophila]